jgi:hypothetical protein
MPWHRELTEERRNVSTRLRALLDEAQLPRIGRRNRRLSPSGIVVGGIESPDEPVQLQRRLPDFQQQAASRAAALDAARAIHRGVVSLVLAAAPFEAYGSDFQRGSNLITLAGLRLAVQSE